MKSRLALLVLFASLLVPISAASQTPDEMDSVPFPHIPTATFGQINLAAQISSDTLFDEPLAMMFIVVGFATEQDAIASFEPMVQHYFEGEQARLDTSLRYDFRMVSVGRLGDERAAFASEGRELLYGSSAKDVHVFTRVGPGILYTRAISLGGETIDTESG